MEELMTSDDIKFLKARIEKDLEKRRIEREKKGIRLINLNKTDLGNLTDASVQYLLDQKILVMLENGSFGICGKKIENDSVGRGFNHYSAFLLVYEDIKEKHPKLKQASLLKIMRETITSVVGLGITMAQNLQTKNSKGKKKKDSYDWSDLS